MWFVAIATLSMLLINFGTHHHAVDGRIESLLPNADSRRIVGGTRVRRGEYPYHVIPITGSICGGTLIWEDVALTAGHCRATFSVFDRLCLGGNDFACRSARGVYNIIQYVQHPDYFRPNYLNDIMLMKLGEAAPGPFVTLNFNASRPAGNDTDSLLAIGYGIREQGSLELSPELLQVTFETFDYEECQDFWRDVANRNLSGSENTLCSGTTEGGRDSCNGDSGGPVFIPNTDIQVGITSFGRGCARPNVPAVNVRVSGYEDWIQSTVCAISSNPPPYCHSNTTESANQLFLVNVSDSTVLDEFGSIVASIDGNVTRSFSRQSIGANLTLLFQTDNINTTSVTFQWNNRSRREFEELFTLSGNFGNRFRRNNYVSRSLGNKTVTVTEYGNRTRISQSVFNFQIVE